MFEQCGSVRAVEEKRNDERRVARASIDDATSNAKQNSHRRLEEETELAGAGQTLGNILQESRGKKIDLPCVVSVPEGKWHGRNQRHRQCGKDNVTEI